MRTVLPGSTLGMLGGGQLGNFFTESAIRMGYKVAVWDPDPDAPAKRFASQSFTGPFTDDCIRSQFLECINVCSLEWENVPVDLVRHLEQFISVRPGSKSLALAQNRITEKTFLMKNGFPVAQHKAITDLQDLEKIKLPRPWVIKTATSGYDGHGQWNIEMAHQLTDTKTLIGGAGPWVVEQQLNFEKELSVVVISNGYGEIMSYPPTENLHENNILRTSLFPARITEKILRESRKLSEDVIRAIDDIGVFCVELFLLGNEDLVVNEIAPRPHNSGHHTMDVFTISQFENQVRCLCQLPTTEPISIGNSILLNLLGDDISTISNHAPQILDDNSTKLYSYGKTSVRPGRKMGHMIFRGTNMENIKGKAAKVRKFIRSKP